MQRRFGLVSLAMAGGFPSSARGVSLVRYIRGLPAGREWRAVAPLISPGRTEIFHGSRHCPLPGNNETPRKERKDGLKREGEKNKESKMFAENELGYYRVRASRCKMTSQGRKMWSG